MRKRVHRRFREAKVRMMRQKVIRRKLESPIVSPVVLVALSKRCELDESKPVGRDIAPMPARRESIDV
jgi:hypothetical protein